MENEDKGAWQCRAPFHYKDIKPFNLQIPLKVPSLQSSLLHVTVMGLGKWEFKCGRVEVRPRRGVVYVPAGW